MLVRSTLLAVQVQLLPAQFDRVPVIILRSRDIIYSPTVSQPLCARTQSPLHIKRDSLLEKDKRLRRYTSAKTVQSFAHLEPQNKFQFTFTRITNLAEIQSSTQTQGHRKKIKHANWICRSLKTPTNYCTNASNFTK